MLNYNLLARTAKLYSAYSYGLVQFWLSSEFFLSNYFQIGQHVVLLHQPRSQGLSSLPPLSTMEAEKRDPGNEVAITYTN